MGKVGGKTPRKRGRMESALVAVRREGPVAHVALDRPEVRNAFNAALIAKVRDTFVALGDDPSVRVIVLSGNGKIFCGGADVSWMRAALELSHDENLEDARRLTALNDSVVAALRAEPQGATAGHRG